MPWHSEGEAGTTVWADVTTPITSVVEVRLFLLHRVETAVEAAVGGASAATAR